MTPNGFGRKDIEPTISAIYGARGVLPSRREMVFDQAGLTDHADSRFVRNGYGLRIGRWRKEAKCHRLQVLDASLLIHIRGSWRAGIA